VNGKKYAAVMVAASPLACEAAKTQDGRRILAADAPRLPLSDCTQPQDCRCRFSKFADRRDGDEGERRHYGVSMRSALRVGKERRRSVGRRRDD
jgi:hypothetical protein